jgi:phage portal protein BeeE
MGISPIAQARQCLASAIAAEKVAGAFFKKGMRPSAILNALAYLSEQQREQARDCHRTVFRGAKFRPRAAARRRLEIRALLVATRGRAAPANAQLSR